MSKDKKDKIDSKEIININEDFIVDIDTKAARASGTIEKRFAGPGPSGWYIGIRWSSVSRHPQNYSSVTGTVYLRTQGNGYSISSSASKSITLVIEGNSGSGNTTVGMGTNTTRDLLTRTVDVWHNGDGSKTCSFSCSAVLGLTLSGIKYNTVSHSGTGVLDKINLNSAPWWTSNNTRMNGIEAHVIIPENWSAVTITSSSAWDNEQGGSLHYDLHRHINGSYSAQIKWGGSGLDVADNIGSWGQGTVIKYEAKVHDGNGLWADGSRWSWEYTKNTFTRSTVDTVSSIGHNSNSLSFTARSARNSGAGNGHVNSDFGYRIESLTAGVGIHGNNTHYTNSQSDCYFTLGIEKAGQATIGAHWLNYNELKNALRGSNFAGNIRLRVVSWNSYGSSGSFDFDVWVDLRQNPEYVHIDYGANNKIRFNNADYYVPSFLPFHISWNGVNDPVDGRPCTYEVFYQVGSNGYVSLGTTSATSYTAYLGSTAIGNGKHDEFRIVVRAITTYGYHSDSGAPRITLWDYAIPTVTVTNVDRRKENLILTGTIRLNSSIPGINPMSSHWRWNSGGPNTNNNGFTTTGSGTTRNFSITITAASAVSGEIHVASSDSIRDLIDPINGVPWGNTNIGIKAYMPVMSLTKAGLGINTRPYSGYRLSIDGNVKVEGNIESWNTGFTPPSHIQVGPMWTQASAWRTGVQEYVDESFKYGTNNTSKYDNNGGEGTTYTRDASDDTPSGSGHVMTVTSKGQANPGWGGFTFQKMTSKNQTITFIFTAKIPIGRELKHAHNAMGDNAAQGWLTNNKGTGKWEQYAFQVIGGTGGSFSSCGFFYLVGGDTPTESNPLRWWISKATCFNNSTGTGNVAIKQDGGLEVGKYIDFHTGISEVNEDYTYRIEGHPKGSHGDDYPMTISNRAGWTKIGTQNSSFTHYETSGVYGHYFNGKLTCTNTFQVNKGCEGNWNYSQIFFPAQQNDSGRIIHYEANNTAQLWLIPSDDPATDGPDRVVVGTLTGNDHSLSGSWHAGISFYTDGRADFAKHINTVGGRCVTQNAANGYWGLSEGGYGGQSWMRTTDAGFIPSWASGEGVGQLGTGGWPFSIVCTRQLHAPDNGWLKVQASVYEHIINGCSTHITIENGWTHDHNHNDPYFRPGVADHGLIGVSSHRWYVGYFRGGSFSSNRETKHDISRMDSEVLYDYIKNMNSYLYRTTIEDNLETGQKGRNRNDLFLGAMVDELPTEVVMYDTEHGDGKSIEIYSYATMIAGALKHAIKTIEAQEKRIQKLEEVSNGIN